MRVSEGGPVPGAVPAYLRSGSAVLNEAENVWLAMLDGWRAQQFARNLAPSTVDARRSIVLQFRAFAESYPWSWTAGAGGRVLHRAARRSWCVALDGAGLSERAADVPGVSDRSRLRVERAVLGPVR